MSTLEDTLTNIEMEVLSDDAARGADVDVENARSPDVAGGNDGVRRRPTISRKSRLRCSHRRTRHRGNDDGGDQRRRREDQRVAQDIIRDIVERRSKAGGGKAILTGPQGLDTIKESGLSLKEKRGILDAVKEEELTRRTRRDRGVGCCTMLSAAIAMKMQHLRYKFFDFVYGINFWQDSIKSVEGLFGTGVGSYFRFLKWLFLLNIPIFLVCFSFVTIPQLIYDFASSSSSDGNCQRKNFLGWELLTGKGNFSCSLLYYGHYTSDTIREITGCNYNMPIFYILSIGLYFLINLVVIAVRISSSYRVNFIEGGGDFKCYFVNKVFAGWDFGVSDPNAAVLKQKSLAQEISEYISLIHSKTATRVRTKGFALHVLQHVLINAAVIAMLVGCGYVMYLLLHYKNDRLNEIKEMSVIGDLITPIVITCVLFFIPKIFSLMTLVEKYELPQRKLYMTLARTVCLYGVVLGNLLWSWIKLLKGDGRRKKDEIGCWENEMGQKIYALVLLDFVMTLLDSLFTDFLRSVAVKVIMLKILKRDPEIVRGYLPNFNVALNTLNLIYSQSLAWFGIFYSPLLPVVQLIKLLLVFYLKKITVLKNCAPFKRAWRGARIQTIFLVLLFLGFMTAIVLFACGIYLAKPSPTCGPYRGRENVHDVLLDFVKGFYNKAPGLYYVVDFLTSSWFIIAVILFLSIKVYYARVSVVARLETINLLKRQLQLSSFDKKFLLKQIQENSQGRYSKEMTNYTPDDREVQNNVASSDSRSARGPQHRTSIAADGDEIETCRL